MNPYSGFQPNPQPMYSPYGPSLYGQQPLPAYGQPVPYPQQQSYGPPMVQQPVDPTIMTTTTQYVTVPQTYNRVNYNWPGAYDRSRPFMLPHGVDQRTADEMMYASQIFREADRDGNGVMTFDEFVPLMGYLGYHMHHHEAVRLFNMIDTDHSGAIDEREFISYWIYAIGPGMGGFKFDSARHRRYRQPITFHFSRRNHPYGLNQGGYGIKLGRFNIQF